MFFLNITSPRATRLSPLPGIRDTGADLNTVLEKPTADHQGVCVGGTCARGERGTLLEEMAFELGLMNMSHGEKLAPLMWGGRTGTVSLLGELHGNLGCIV